MDYHHSEISEVLAPRPLVKETSTWLTDNEAEKLCKLFGDGLDAGIGYDRIFDFMIRQKLDKGMIAKLRSSVVEHGDQLGEAFTRLGLLDGVSRKVILVAEEQGELVSTFREQGRMFGARHRQKKAIIISLADPFVMVTLGFVLRQIYSVTTEAIQAESIWTVILPAAGVGLVQAAIFGCFWGLGLYAWFVSPVDSGLMDAVRRFLSSVPGVSLPLRQRAIANFSRYLRQSIRAGMDMVRSVDLAAEAANSTRYTRHLDQVAQALEAGYSLEQALSVMKGLPVEFLDYLGIGEETGKLEENLDFLTQKYDKLSDDNYQRLVDFAIYMIRILAIIIIFVFIIFAGFAELGKGF